MADEPEHGPEYGRLFNETGVLRISRSALVRIKNKPINIGTWNVRSMLAAGKIFNTIREMKILNIGILGISEMRWPNNGVTYIEDHCVYHSGSSDTLNRNGVGVIVSKDINKSVLEVRAFGERVIMIKLQLTVTVLNVIQVYAPTCESNDEEINDFYNKIDEVISLTNNREVTILMGDMNSKVGEGKVEKVVGAFGLGARNERGERFIEFCQNNNLVITNTFYKLPPRRLYTWRSPADKPEKIVRNQIDYITINSRYKNAIKSVKTYPGADVPSDHNLLLAKFRLRFKKIAALRPYKKHDVKDLRNEKVLDKVKVSLNGKLQELYSEMKRTQNHSELWNNTKNIIQEVTESNLSGKEIKKKKAWMTKEILDMMDRRRCLKNNDPDEYKKLHCEIRKCIREAKANWFREQCEELEMYEKSFDSFNMFKKIKSLVDVNKGFVVRGIEDSKGNMIYDTRKKLLRWKGYIENLFQDQRNAPNVDYVSSGPPIIESEVLTAIKRLKNDRANGPDDIFGEVLKLIEGEGIKVLLELFNAIYNSGQIPEDWLRSTFIAIPKKTQARKCEDYRTISLMSHVLKTFLKVIHERIYRKIEDRIGDTQFGFRSGLGTRDALFGMQVLLQRCRDLNQDVYICFIDFEKAFDRVRHNKLIEILKTTNVDDKDIRIIANLYWNQRATLRIGGEHTDDFEIRRGVRQGCVLSPLLFNLYSEEIFKEALSGLETGISINGEVLNNFRYADDTVLLANNLADLRCMLQRVNDVCKTYGMMVNTSKTKYMIVSRYDMTDSGLLINGSSIQRVKKFKYLGCYLNDGLDYSQEIRGRIEQARAAFVKMKKLLCSNELTIELRARLAKCYVFPVLLYGVEAWTLTDAMLRRLEAFEMWIYRRMLKVSYVDHITNEQILQRMKKKAEVVNEIKSRKLEYLGHIMRNEQKYGLLQKIIQGKIVGNRPPGRRRTSWLKNLRKWYNKSTIQLFRAAVDKVIIARMIANVRVG